MDINFTTTDLAAILPAAILFLTGLVILFTDLFVRDPDVVDDTRSGKSHLVMIGVCGAAISFVTLLLDGGLLDLASGNRPAFGGALGRDAFGGFAAAIIIIALVLTTLSAGGYLAAQRSHQGEFYGLLYLGGGAMVLLAESTNLLAIFLAVETLSLSVYVLAGFHRRSRASAEGALKYFVMGAFSSGFLLLGMAFVYGATGGIALAALAQPDADHMLLNMGLLLMVIGFAFKIGAVPFHSWVPDAYQGAPAVAAGWMAVSVKVCSFAALIRIMVALTSAGAVDASLGKMLAALAVITMIAGNLMALLQTNVKRLLAYSGIAHSGYLLIPVVLAFRATPNPEVGGGALFYLAAYLLMTLGAFAAVAIISRGEGDREELAHFNGLARRQPFVALAFTVCLLSLAGIPGTAGFLGKLTIFKDAVNSDVYLYLALIGILASLVSVYYYLRPIVAMYFRDEQDEVSLVESPWGLKLTLWVSTIGTVGLFLFGKPIHELSIASIRSITG